MKKFILSLLTVLLVVMMPLNVLAAKTTDTTEEDAETTTKEEINVYIFWGNGCGYCEAALEFFSSIEEEYGDYFELVKYEVWYDKANNALKEEVVEYFGDDVTGVPYIVIGDVTFGGYASDYDEDIKTAIKEAYEADDYEDIVAKIQNGDIEAPKNYDTLIVISIFVVIIGGFGALVYFSRK